MYIHYCWYFKPVLKSNSKELEVTYIASQHNSGFYCLFLGSIRIIPQCLTTSTKWCTVQVNFQSNNAVVEYEYPCKTTNCSIRFDSIIFMTCCLPILHYKAIILPFIFLKICCYSSFQRNLLLYGSTFFGPILVSFLVIDSAKVRGWMMIVSFFVSPRCSVFTLYC